MKKSKLKAKCLHQEQTIRLLGNSLKAEIKENEILNNALTSCENALHEKEIIIKYLELKLLERGIT